MAEGAREKLSYVARLVALADVTSKREIRRQLLEMVGEVLDESEKEATILRGLELTARLTGACDMAAVQEPMGIPDLKRFEKARREQQPEPAQH
jgi:hypothetical protein